MGDTVKTLKTIYFTIRTGSRRVSEKLINEFNNLSRIDFVKNMSDGKIYIHASAKINPDMEKKFKRDLEKKLNRTVKIIGIEK